MGYQNVLVELILAGFFAIACLRTSVPAVAGEKLEFSNMFRLPPRLERLRRSRWQWFSMVALLLVIRAQRGAPMVAEMTVALEFILFIAAPTRAPALEEARTS